MVKPSHLVARSFSIILLAIAEAAMVVAEKTHDLLWFSPFTILLVIVYLLAMRGIFLREKTQPVELPAEVKEVHSRPNELRHALAIYSIHALIVIAAALFLPWFGENIVLKTGISDSFFGTLFLAITTSLPELVISISALRVGALDMAMGNLMGSNVFSIFILAINDLFFADGSLYRVISDTHLLSVLASILMSAVVAVGLVTRPEKKI